MGGLVQLVFASRYILADNTRGPAPAFFYRASILQAARLAAMKEKREMKRRASLKEVDEALSYLSIIDNLSED